MPHKLLTIITVTKNCVRTVERTIKSVQAIKSDAVEYIVVDSVSDDGTLKIIEKYSDLIDCLVCEPDSGIYNAMNKGIASAKGDFILFINGDDELIPDGVKQVLEILPACDEQIVCASTFVLGNSVNPSFSYDPAPHLLVYWDSIPHPSTFVRRKLLVEFPFREDLQIASDYDFFQKAFLSGKSFKVIPYHTALHYYGGASSNIAKTKMEVDLVLKENLGRWRAFRNKLILIFWFGPRKSLGHFLMNIRNLSDKLMSR